ncbi:hypothetical protein E2C01_014614 [Portunus trituberculatus]|uniref:Uncharacterized protein n=1 Tax=Portunus trituberculatus TaxID=210409 RepID=A0A5B7DKH6_PORTR|nr:hypothetical protein [Portunus trituberculatus]
MTKRQHRHACTLTTVFRLVGPYYPQTRQDWAKEELQKDTLVVCVTCVEMTTQLLAVSHPHSLISK